MFFKLNENKVHKKVIQIFMKQNKIDKRGHDFVEDNFVEVYGISSLKLFQYLMTLENKFGISFDMDEFDIEGINNFKILSNYIFKLLTKKELISNKL